MPGDTGSYQLRITFEGDSVYEGDPLLIPYVVSDDCHYIKLTIRDDSTSYRISGALVNADFYGTDITDSLGRAQISDIGEDEFPFDILVTKDGYVDGGLTIESADDLDQEYTVFLIPTDLAVVTDDWSLLPGMEKPDEVSDVTEGFLQIAYSFMASPFNWFFLIIIFLIAIGVVRLLFIAVLG